MIEELQTLNGFQTFIHISQGWNVRDGSRDTLIRRSQTFIVGTDLLQHEGCWSNLKTKPYVEATFIVTAATVFHLMWLQPLTAYHL